MNTKHWLSAVCLPALFVLVETSDNTAWGGPACLVALLLLPVFALASGFHGLRMTFRKQLTGLPHAGLGILFLGLFVGYFRQGGDGLATRSVLGDGTEIEVRQHHTGFWTEPYLVTLAVRSPGLGWRTWYVDHQDLRWWFGFIHHDPSSQTVRFGRLLSDVGRLDLRSGELVLARRPTQRSEASTLPITRETGPDLERQATARVAVSDRPYRSLTVPGTLAGPVPSRFFPGGRQ